MFRCGLLLLTNRLSVCPSNLLPILNSALQYVSDCLYVHLTPEGSFHSMQTNDDVIRASQLLPSANIKQLITDIYTSATQCAKQTDVRVLLSNICADGLLTSNPYQLKRFCDVLLLPGNEDVILKEKVIAYAIQLFPNSLHNNATVKTLPVKKHHDTQSVTHENEPFKIYEHTCLGGTFDRLHSGHKLLLSQGALISSKSLTVGVTDGEMNRRKLLGELMESTEARIGAVLDFVQDVKPNLEYKVVPITDPFGPAIVDGNLQCIIASAETLRGAHAVNTRREDADLSPLDVELIDILPESSPTEADAEEKMSSSNQRIRLLGTLLQPPSSLRPSRPYVIGLTGGIASGKSSVCQRLHTLGAAIVDCDKLGHLTYQKGTRTWDEVVSVFGRAILTPEEEIDRRALGAIVFASKSELEKLNQIVWPAIAELAKKEIEKYHLAGYKIVVLDAAVLLEAGWNESCHEVWTCIVPIEEATKRLMDRNKLTEEQASQRISSQLSNHQRVSRSNVVLSTLWEPHVTQKQVEKAWALLQNRIPAPPTENNVI